MNTPSFHVHGAQGFGNFIDINPIGKADPRPAHVFLSETIRANPNEIILCPIGPLSNIANLLEYDPDIVNHLKKVVIMGVLFMSRKRNIFAEANFWNDPHAAEKVLAADWEIDLIGLDVTSTIQFPPKYF